MPKKHEEFTFRLTEIIEDIAHLEGQNMGIIEKEISVALDKGETHVTSYLRQKGNIPTKRHDLQQLASELAKRINSHGKIIKDKAWFREFLFHGKHANPDEFVEELFSSVEEDNVAEEEPFIQQEHEGNFEYEEPITSSAPDNVFAPTNKFAPVVQPNTTSSWLPIVGIIILGIIAISIVAIVSISGMRNAQSSVPEIANSVAPALTNTANVIMPISPTATPISTSNLLKNPSFEGTHGSLPWYWTSEDCSRETQSVDTALDGEVYLATSKNRSEQCKGFFQDMIDVMPTVDDTYHFAIRVRSPTGAKRNGRIALHATGAEPTNDDYQEQFFTTSNTRWQCIEVSLHITKSDNNRLLVFVYLDSKERMDYHFDKAELQKGEDRICPLLTEEKLLQNGNVENTPHADNTNEEPTPRHDLQIHNPTIESYDYFLGSTISVQSLITHAHESITQPYVLGYYIAENDNGIPLNGNMWKRTITSQDFQENAGFVYADLFIMLELEAENTYFVVFETDMENHISETNESNNKVSLPFTVKACDASTMFCDVPPLITLIAGKSKPGEGKFQMVAYEPTWTIYITMLHFAPT